MLRYRVEALPETKEELWVPDVLTDDEDRDFNLGFTVPTQPVPKDLTNRYNKNFF